MVSLFFVRICGRYWPLFHSVWARGPWTVGFPAKPRAYRLVLKSSHEYWPHINLLQSIYTIDWDPESSNNIDGAFEDDAESLDNSEEERLQHLQDTNLPPTSTVDTESEYAAGSGMDIDDNDSDISAAGSDPNFEPEDNSGVEDDDVAEAGSDDDSDAERVAAIQKFQEE